MINRCFRTIICTARMLGFGTICLLTFSSIAQADSIGGPGSSCGTCQGSTYTLSYSGSPIDSDPTTETFRITLDIDTSTYTGNINPATGTNYPTFIDAVAIKVSPSVISSTLFAAPDGTSNWSIVLGGLNANGCNGNGSGFSCADYVATGPGVAIGGLLSWTFEQEIPKGTLFTGPNEATIKARYVDELGGKVGALVSENITLQTATPIPEPSTVLLLGTGLLGIGLARWATRR